MDDLGDIFDEPLITDLLFAEDSGDGIDWGFADAIGAAILALAGELRRRQLTRDEARTWLKVTDHAGGIFFDIVWSQAVRISGVSPSSSWSTTRSAHFRSGQWRSRSC